MADTQYSEFYTTETNYEKHLHHHEPHACQHCGLTARYQFAEQHEGECKFCRDFAAPTFRGAEQLVRDLDLAPSERIGLTVSGGKDSIYMWAQLSQLIGADRIVAFNHNKIGLVHPLALANIQAAKVRLGSKLITINDHEMLGHFQRNLRGLLADPRPEVVRMVLCTGCRYGITKALYQKGDKLGIRKYVSGASYLELAPFKEELIDDPAAVDDYLAGNPDYDYDDNIELIRRDSGLKYKNNLSSDDGVGHVDTHLLFDFDHYFPNNPAQAESFVRQHMGWQRPERSWHFDCLVETIKDVFYYGLMGYTESDFKLSAMVRHGLLSRAEADHQLAVVNHRIENSLPDVLELLDYLHCSDLRTDMIEFFRCSPYLHCDQAAVNF